MDTALRRRFEFVEMMPKPELLKKIKYGTTIIKDTNTGNEKEIDEVIDLEKMLGTMNARIEALYDREHTIGHALFMPLKEEGKNNIQELGKIFKNKIIPLLQEYFYDDYSKIQLVLGDNAKDNEKEKFIKEVPLSNNIFMGKEDGIKIKIPNKKYIINMDNDGEVFNLPEAYTKIYPT